MGLAHLDWCECELFLYVTQHFIAIPSLWWVGSKLVESQTETR